MRNPSLSFRKISDSLGGVQETSVQKTIKFLHPIENPFGCLIGVGYSHQCRLSRNSKSLANVVEKTGNAGTEKASRIVRNVATMAPHLV